MENLNQISENTVKKYSLEKDGFIYKIEATFNDNKLINLECKIEVKQSDVQLASANKGYMNFNPPNRKMINVDKDVDSAVTAATFEEILKAVTPEVTTA